LVIEALYGDSGIALDKFLRKLHWVYIFRNFAGLFPYITYNGVYLHDPTMSLQELNDFKDFPIHFGEHLIDFLCGISEDDAEDTNTSSASSASSSAAQDSSNPLDNIFTNVVDPKLARQAMRLFLYTRYVSRQGMYLNLKNVSCLLHFNI